jgi:hypothetical protein
MASLSGSVQWIHVFARWFQARPAVVSIWCPHSQRKSQASQAHFRGRATQCGSCDFTSDLSDLPSTVAINRTTARYHNHVRRLQTLCAPLWRSAMVRPTPAPEPSLSNLKKLTLPPTGKSHGACPLPKSSATAAACAASTTSSPSSTQPSSAPPPPTLTRP